MKVTAETKLRKIKITVSSVLNYSILQSEPSYYHEMAILIDADTATIMWLSRTLFSVTQSTSSILGGVQIDVLHLFHFAT